MNNQQKSYLFAVLSIFFWSTAATAFKIALRYLDFIQVLFVASSTTVVILTCILGVQRRLNEIFQYSIRQYLYSALLGFFNPFLYYMVLLKAYSLLPAQIAQPLNYVWPLMLVLLSVPLLKQKLSLVSFLAILVSFSGVFVISSQGRLASLSISNPVGVFLAVGSSVIWALFWILNVRDKRNEINKLFLNFVFGTIFIFIALVNASSLPLFPLNGIWAGIYIGFFEMGITFVLWLKALQLTDSNEKISNLVYFSPFLALVFIHFILGEKIYYTTLAGLFLIVSGIVIQQINNRKKKNATN